MNWIENYMNNVTVRAELGASEDVEFKSCNMDVNQGFLFQVRALGFGVLGRDGDVERRRALTEFFCSVLASGRAMGCIIVLK